MTLSDFLRKPIFNIPTSYSDDFLTHIEDLLMGYLNQISSIKATDQLEIQSFHKPLSEIIERQEKFVNGLISSIKIYLSGQPYNAYLNFYATINPGQNEQPGLKWLMTPHAPFYRIRKSNGKPFESEDLFHIPFEKRGKVRSQRYSISGFPSLYLSNSLYTWRRELNCPTIEELYYIELKSTRNLNFFNLTWNPHEQSSSKVGLYYSLMRWPLIALCSVKVKNPEDNFKPEYIIPQILLQWIRNNKNFDGIAYDSTHVDKNNTPQKGYFQNFVLPVKENKVNGFCNFLSDIFESTRAFSMSDILKDENYFIDNKRRPINTGHKTTIIESEKNNLQYITYSDSLLSKIELSSHYLPKTNLKEIFKERKE